MARKKNKSAHRKGRVKVYNDLAKAIDINNASAMYDMSIKELLADKQILARIVKYSVEEFANNEIDEIISWMDEPFISKVPVEPGMTNNKIRKGKLKIS